MQRYDINGVVDTDFGDGGLVSTDFGGDRDCAYGVAIQPDGKIVVAGESRQNGSGDVGVVRYDTAGTPDSSFGDDGTGLVTTDIAGELDLASDVTIDADDNIVVAARVSVDSSLDHFAVVRYTPAGLLDSAFASDGITEIDLGVPGGIDIDADTKIVVAGTHNSGIATGQSNFALWRFTSTGDRDSTFDGDGLVTTDFPDVAGQTRHGEIGNDLALHPDGRIVVVGRADFTPSTGLNIRDVAMARYQTDGALDTSFGTGGTLIIDFAAGSDIGHDVAIQPDGKIVASATATNGTNTELGLMRINN